MSKIIKNIFLSISIIILVTGWLALTGLTFYCSASLTCDNDATGWWSLFVTIVGVPILMFQLYVLRDTIIKSVAKPIVDIGITNSNFDSKSGQEKPLPLITQFKLSKVETFIELVNNNPDMLMGIQSQLSEIIFPIKILIRNSGNKALRFTKINIALIQHPHKERPTIAIKKFDLSVDKTAIVFRGSAEHTIYPKDYEEHQLIIAPNETERYFMMFDKILEPNKLPDIRKIYKPGNYEFECTIWADGLDEPYTKKLSLKVIDDRQNIETLTNKVIDTIENTETQTKHSIFSSKYGFETAEDRTRERIAEEAKQKRIEIEKLALKLALEEKIKNRANEINPLILDILSDFILAYEMNHINIERYEETIWYFVKYSEKKFAQLEIAADKNGKIIFEMESLEYVGLPESFSRLKDVIESTTQIPVIIHNRRNYG